MSKIVAIVFVLLSTNACAEWVKLIENSKGTVFYVDPATKKGGKNPRVWVLGIYSQSKPDGDRAFRALSEADCLKGAMRDLTATFFLDVGLKNSSGIQSEPEPWQFPAPGTVHEAMYTYLCGKAP